MIGYDLHAGENYKDLTDAICRYGKPWHCLDSTWLIESNDTATIIKKNLMQHIKPDDRLLVMRYGKGVVAGMDANASWHGFTNDCKTWLQNNT